MDGYGDILHCNRPVLEKADSFKYLSWKKHITEMHNNINFGLGILILSE